MTDGKITNADWCKANNIKFSDLSAQTTSGGKSYRIVKIDKSGAVEKVVGTIIKTSGSESTFHAFKRWLDSDVRTALIDENEVCFLDDLIGQIKDIITSIVFFQDNPIYGSIWITTSEQAPEGAYYRKYIIPFNVEKYPFINIERGKQYKLADLGL